MDRVHPAAERALLWYWGEAPGEIAALHSSWPAEARAPRDGAGRVDPSRNYVYVPSSGYHAQAYQLDGRAVAAAARARRIAWALHLAGQRAELILWLRFGKVLTRDRAMFTLGEAERVLSALKFASSSNKVTRERARLAAISRRAQPERGCGSLAHLTDAAHGAWEACRTTLAIDRWTDRLGQKLASGRASVDDRALEHEITRQAERLVLDAYELYRRGARWVPEVVRRRAVG